MKTNALLSGEFILSKGKRPNGGGVVVCRSIWVTIWIMFLVLLLWNWLRPCINCTVQLTVLKADIINLAPWIGAVFGGVYVAFYTRFSSQWTYLANLYNQIKQSEVSQSKNMNALAQWKAGFVEDAIELHLASKPNIAVIIRAWLVHEDVRNAFVNYTEDGVNRLENIKNLLRIKD